MEGGEWRGGGEVEGRGMEGRGGKRPYPKHPPDSGAGEHSGVWVSIVHNNMVVITDPKLHGVRDTVNHEIHAALNSCGKNDS